MLNRAAVVLFSVALGAGLLHGANPAQAVDDVPTQNTSATEFLSVQGDLREGLPAIIRVWTTVSDRHPVAGARIRLIDRDGRTLARATSAANGQAILMLDEAPPRGASLVSIGGASEGILSGILRMRGRVRAVPSQVVDINPLTTLESACAETRRSRPACDRMLHRALGMPIGPDHSRLAALADWHFSAKGMIESAERDNTSIWQVARSAVSQGASGVSELRAVSPRPRTVVQPAGVASALAEAVLGTIASKVAAPYVDKLLLAMGLQKPTPDVATAEQVAQLQQQLDVVEQQLATVEAQQQSSESLLNTITGTLDEMQYTTLRSSFLRQSGDLATLAQDLHYLMAYTDCSQSNANSSECGTPLAEDAPTTGVGPTDCASTANAVNDWQKAALVQCAYLLNTIAAYTANYAQNVARTTLVGDGGMQAGLVQWAQVAYASHVGDGLVTTANQANIRTVGEYWLSQWSVDISAWLIASNQAGVLPNTQQPAVVFRIASGDAQDADDAGTDTTGRYFGKQINTLCTTMVFNQRTGTKMDLVLNVPDNEYDNARPCDTSSNWGPLQKPRITSGTIPNFAALAAHFRPTTEVAALANCIHLNDDPNPNSQFAGLDISVCDSVSLNADSAEYGRACISPMWTRLAQIRYFRPTRSAIGWPQPEGAQFFTASSCADFANLTVGAPWSGGIKICQPSYDIFNCRDRYWAGPIVDSLVNVTDQQQPGYGGGTLLSLLPLGAPADQRATTYSRYWLMESPLNPGEVFLPRT